MDVTEIELILDNLEYLEKQLYGAISRWKKNIKTCDWAVDYMSKGVLKGICKNQIELKEIFGPLYSFLRTYIAIRNKRIAYTGKSLDKFFIRGLKAIQKYTVVSNFFAENPQYFFPNESLTNVKKFTKAQVSQQKYKEFIINLNERLIGCKNKLNFMFLGLLGTVKTPLSDELKDMKNYLENQCLFMRTKKLKFR